MTKSITFLTLLTLVLPASGCLVRSVYPWLSEDTEVSDISLEGSWWSSEGTIAFFKSDGDAFYSTHFDNGEEQQGITACLHRLDQTLLLVLGPGEDAGTLTTLPAYLILKVGLNGDTMKLYDLEFNSFGDRMKKQGLRQLGEGDQISGHVLLSTTKELTSFMRSQLCDPTLFSKEPMYTFRKLEED